MPLGQHRATYDPRHGEKLFCRCRVSNHSGADAWNRRPSALDRDDPCAIGRDPLWRGSISGAVLAEYSSFHPCSAACLAEDQCSWGPIYLSRPVLRHSQLGYCHVAAGRRSLAGYFLFTRDTQAGNVSLKPLRAIARDGWEKVPFNRLDKRLDGPQVMVPFALRNQLVSSSIGTLAPGSGFEWLWVKARNCLTGVRRNLK